MVLPSLFPFEPGRGRFLWDAKAGPWSKGLRWAPWWKVDAIHRNIGLQLTMGLQWDKWTNISKSPNISRRPVLRDDGRWMEENGVLQASMDTLRCRTKLLLKWQVEGDDVTKGRDCRGDNSWRMSGSLFFHLDRELCPARGWWQSLPGAAPELSWTISYIKFHYLLQGF